MQIPKSSFYSHLAFWLIYWFIQSLLFSGGRHLDFYLAKNVAIVSLHALLVYANLRELTRLLLKGQYLIYTLISIGLIYLTYSISFEIIGLSFAIFFPGVTRMIVPGDTSWWPTDFWQILSGSAPYSIAFLGSTIFSLLKLNSQSTATDSLPDSNTGSYTSDEDYTLMLKEGKVIHRLDVRDILYVQGMKEYVSWHTTDKKLVTLHSLANLETLLGEKGFLRTHKSFIVNTKCVEVIKYDSVEIPGKKIPIGRSYRTKVQDCFRSEI
ncbi:MAG: LytTR family transcriptional regulator [Roseivirga sp.]|nr:LytTR family transcriptional regulator [Roseivirga sp.]